MKSYIERHQKIILGRRVFNKSAILGWLMLSFFLQNAFSEVYHVNPVLSRTEINEKLKTLLPGDTLFFEKGSYQGPFNLENINGELNNPIVITGWLEGNEYQCLIDNESEAGSDLMNSAFILNNCSWIEIRDFKMINCWTDVIFADETSYLSIDNCDINGGKRALFAIGRNSHHFLVENCRWEQDPKVWDHTEGYSWDELHHGKYVHYNGSIFQGKEISGSFVLRNNLIINSFNAFRLSLIAGGKVDSLAGTNGDIYNNTIINTADNVLEPELFCHNLYFYHNRIINGHALISFTEVGGGYVYIYGNTALSLPDSDDGWTIFKISKSTRAFSNPFYVFNNSWYVDFDIVGSNRNVWENDEIVHFNNACYIENQDSFGIYRTGKNNSFDYDCSNLPFPKWFIQEGHEKNGIVKSPEFLDPFNNDFRLAKISPCIDKGKMDMELIKSFKGTSPDIGAYEGDDLVFGKPFTYMKEVLETNFIEHPRISAFTMDDSYIKFWFTLPVSAESIKASKLELVDRNFREPLIWHPELSDSLCLVFSAKSIPVNKRLRLSVSGNLLGVNGAKLTSWATAFPMLFLENGTQDSHHE